MATTFSEFGQDTGSEASSMGSQTAGSITGLYTGTVDDVKAATDVTPIKEDAYAAGVATSNLGDSATSLVSSIGSSGSAYAELAETTGLVAQEVLIRKLEELRSQLFEMRTVKLKSLLCSTGAFITTATTPGEFVESITSNTSKAVGKLPAVLKKAATELAVEVGSDPRVLSSLASLKEVQALAKTIDSIYKMYEAVRKVSDRFEPLFPIIEITVSAAMIWCTGGGAAAKMSSESAQLAMQELKKIIPLVAKPMKDYIYNKEIKVPAMLIGMLDTISTQEASDRFAALKQEAEEYLLADDARYTEINNSLKFPGAYNRLTSTIVNKSSLAQAFVEKFLGGSTLASTLVRTIMYSSDWAERRDQVEAYRGASYVTRKSLASCIRDFELRDKDIRRISKLIVDNRDTTATFYTDRQMHKLVVAELERDGCIADVSKEAYDEVGTQNFPEGDRLTFKMVNERITGLHYLLQGITGEQRANIQETIPVIDFYRRSFTGLNYRYKDSTFNTIEKITPYARDSLMNTDGYDLIVNEEASLINMALEGYPVAEYFYNTKERMSDEKNLVVEYTTNASPSAPGLLNGLFSKKVQLDGTTESITGVTDKLNAAINQLNYISNSTKPSQWRWVDERSLVLGRSSVIDLGTLYNTCHIRDRGTIVPRPLETAAPYPGKATEYFFIAKTFFDSLVATYTIPNDEWSSYGRRIDSVITKGNRLGVVPLVRTTKISRHALTIHGNFNDEYYYNHPYQYGPNVQFEYYESKAKYADRIGTLTVEALEEMIQYLSGLNKTVEGVRTLDISTASTYRAFVDMTTPPSDGRNYGYSSWNGRGPSGSGIGSPRYSASGGETYGPYGTPIESSTYNRFHGGLDDGAPSKLCVYIETTPDDYVSFYNRDREDSGTGKIRNIRILTPLGLLQRQGNTKSNVVLFCDRERGIGKVMWLISKYDLGFNTTTNRTFATFALQDRAMALRVTAVYHIDPELMHLRVGMQYYGFADNVTHGWPIAGHEGEYIPRVDVEGGACYAYKLEGIDTNNLYLQYHLTPLRSDADFFGFLGEKTLSAVKWGHLDNTEADLRQLDGAMVSVNLPTLTTDLPDYSYFTKQGTNYDPLNRMLNESACGNYAAGMLFNYQILINDYVESAVLFEDLDLLLEPWIQPATRRAVLSYMEDISGLEKLPNMLNRFERIAKAFRALQYGKVTQAICADIDSILGNNATPWLSIGTGPNDDISSAALGDLADRIKVDLLGTDAQGPYPVHYIEGADRVTGRADSLYYQRYMFLNARMHKTEGAIAKAAYLLYNWQLVKDARTFQDTQVANYTDFLDALAIPQVDTLMYSPPKNEGDEGRFYLKELLDEIRAQISDKCMLVCAPCPVKDSCPFYDEDTILYMYVPPATTLDIYLKDNELDLLVYEQDEDGNEYLNITSDAGTRISAAEMQLRHKLYTEIVRDDEQEINLDVIRETVASKVNGFKIQEDRYVDGLDWLHGGRYGTIVLATESGDVVADVKKHKYLYDAVFIRDQETSIIYGETAAAYPVSFEVKEGNATVKYSGSVRLKKPIDITMGVGSDGRPAPLSLASKESELWLISDDELDEEGNAMVPMIYLNTLGNLHYDFEFIESGETIDTDTDKRYPGAGDMAQWIVNGYKWMEPTEDKYWMPSITKVVRASKKGGEAVITLPGRPRVFDVVDPLIDSEPPIEDILRGKPYVRNYVNFVRKVRFQLSDIRWTKSNDRTEIETRKKQLASMKTNLRLVLVKK